MYILNSKQHIFVSEIMVYIIGIFFIFGIFGKIGIFDIQSIWYKWMCIFNLLSVFPVLKAVIKMISW